MEAYDKPFPIMAQRHISLRINGIFAYGKELQEMPTALTGRITLVGVGSDLLMSGDVIGTAYVEG